LSWRYRMSRDDHQNDQGYYKQRFELAFYSCQSQFQYEYLLTKMIYKIDYSLMGQMQSVGHIQIGRHRSHQIENFGTIYVTYSLLGRILTIDGRECGYKGWFSPLLSIGNMPVSLDRSGWQ
jgi:hypothetical protein